jgi:hypothetical protein
MTGLYLDSLPPICYEKGCQAHAAELKLIEAQGILNRATRLQRKAEENKQTWDRRYEVRNPQMARALWCDQCDTAYSEKDPGRKQLRQTEYDEDGDEVTKTLDLCGSCAASMFRRPALPGTVQDARPKDA